MDIFAEYDEKLSTKEGFNAKRKFLQADVLCPFYINDSNKPPKIKCEGLSDKTGWR